MTSVFLFFNIFPLRHLMCFSVDYYPKSWNNEISRHVRFKFYLKSKIHLIGIPGVYLVLPSTQDYVLLIENEC